MWGTLFIVIVIMGLAYLGLYLFGRSTAALFDETPEEIERKNAERSMYASAVGRRGVCVSDCRPQGVVVVDGKRLEAVSEDGFIAQGANVEVSRHKKGGSTGGIAGCMVYVARLFEFLSGTWRIWKGIWKSVDPTTPACQKQSVSAECAACRFELELSGRIQNIKEQYGFYNHWLHCVSRIKGDNSSGFPVTRCVVES